MTPDKQNPAVQGGALRKPRGDSLLIFNSDKLLSLQGIAYALGGKVVCNKVIAPTPGHSKRDTGTVVTLDLNAPDGVLVHCFNGNKADALAVKDILRDAGILPSLNSRRREISQAEREAIKRQAAKQTGKRQAEKFQQWEEVAQVYRVLFEAAIPANANHPYLVTKRIGTEGIWQIDDLLILPMVDEFGLLWNIQTIDRNGKKMFQPRARTTGVFWRSFGPKPGECRVVIGEGMATVAAVKRATGLPVIAALSASNLPAVAQIVHRKFPTAQIIIAADDDAAGLKAAREAAQATGAQILNAGEVA